MIEFKDASLELQRITERLHSGIQWIHYQCHSVSKKEEYHLMCLTLGLNITERFRQSSSPKAPTRTFVAWKLENMLRLNRLKVENMPEVEAQRETHNKYLSTAANVIVMDR